ncbi:MAG: hypothetical protein C4334_05280 [Pyrinomonas sp.]|uniref:YqaA family protein n=1 Tax=Pyrinomonas sp. TaxID=2080306 RepID=UPI0033340241
MMLLPAFFTGRFAQLAHYLTTFGVFGVFAIALLDSALVPLPGGPDAALMLLAATHPAWSWVYVLAAAAGSVIGCVALYRIAHRAGRRALDRFSTQKRARVERWIARYDVLAVLVASILPPPFPFKLFVVSAGVFRLNLVRFALAIGAGRAFRFSLEAFLAARYGDRASAIVAQHYPAIGLVVAVALVAFFVAKRCLWRTRPSLG